MDKYMSTDIHGGDTLPILRVVVDPKLSTILGDCTIPSPHFDFKEVYTMDSNFKFTVENFLLIVSDKKIVANNNVAKLTGSTADFFASHITEDGTQVDRKIDPSNHNATDMFLLEDGSVIDLYVKPIGKNVKHDLAFDDWNISRMMLQAKSRKMLAGRIVAKVAAPTWEDISVSFKIKNQHALDLLMNESKGLTISETIAHILVAHVDGLSMSDFSKFQKKNAGEVTTSVQSTPEQTANMAKVAMIDLLNQMGLTVEQVQSISALAGLSIVK